MFGDRTEITCRKFLSFLYIRVRCTQIYSYFKCGLNIFSVQQSIASNQHQNHCPIELKFFPEKFTVNWIANSVARFSIERKRAWGRKDKSFEKKKMCKFSVDTWNLFLQIIESWMYRFLQTIHIQIANIAQVNVRKDVKRCRIGLGRIQWNVREMYSSSIDCMY